MKGVVLDTGWEKTAMEALLRWDYLNDWALELFPWFYPTCPGNVIQRRRPSVN